MKRNHCFGSAICFRDLFLQFLNLDWTPCVDIDPKNIRVWPNVVNRYTKKNPLGRK